MRYKAPFQLFKKTLASGTKVYYYTTYDKLNKRRQYSTGCKNKAEALQFCLEKFKNGNLLRDRSTLFRKYTEKWFIYDECPYIQNVLSRGKRYSKSGALAKRSILINKLYPYFGNSKLEDIKALHIEDWIRNIKSTKLSNLTINQYLSVLKLIFKEAYRTGVIKSNPGEKVKNLAKKGRVKSVLKENEVEALFNVDKIDLIWDERMFYLINLIASNTGMRLGEIQALQEKNIHKDHIEVKYSWERAFGLKCPKNGKTRIVPIKYDLYKNIKSYTNNLNNTGPFIFSHNEGKRPIGHTNIYRVTYKAFEYIGINDIERRERNITIHSWRHYFNTKLLKNGVVKSVVQAIIGHSTDDMTDNYTKLTKEDLISAVKH